MKKILSLLIFAVTLIWTWSLIHSSTNVGFETHSGIQQRLTEMIEASLKKARPEAQDLEIFKLWTETLSNNKVRAVFAYKFSDKAENGEMVGQTVAGEAILYREPSDVENEDLWILQSVKTTNDNLVFAEGSLISPNMSLEEEGSAVEGSANPADGSGNSTPGGPVAPVTSPAGTSATDNSPAPAQN